MDQALFVVIPAYNEEKRIEKTVRDYAKYFGHRAVIFVVVNGSSDRTGAVVQRLSNEYPNVRCIEFSEAMGKGGAVQAGFRHILSKETRYEGRDTSLIGFVDADEATTPAEYDRLVKQLGDFDGVIGSRFLEESVVSGRSWIRSVAGHLFRRVVHIFFRLPYADTQCGVKMFRREALQTILPELKIHNMAFDVEMLVVARKHGLRIAEIATVWDGKPNSGSLGSPLGMIRAGWNMFWTLIVLRKRITSI